MSKDVHLDLAPRPSRDQRVAVSSRLAVAGAKSTSFRSLRQTPYFCFDMDAVRAQYWRLAAAFPFADIHYAVKANPAPAILAVVDGCGGGFEFASGPELDLLARAGIP